MPLRIFAAALAVLLALASPLRADDLSARKEDAARLAVVVAYADTVLAQAADRYHSPASPLLANGIDVVNHDQLLWIYPDGHQAVFSDFALQQNLVRTLVGLSRLTGKPRYEAAARAQAAYYFDHYQDPATGLLIWGGHRFIDLLTLQPRGVTEHGITPHELKNVFPDYDLLYSVNPSATVRYIQGFWHAHVFHWRTLEVSRHGEYGRVRSTGWDHPFDDPAPFFETKGLGFLDAGDDLIYSGAALYRLNGDKGALLWTNRLAAMYVKARDPHTDLGAYQFSQPRKTAEAPDDAHTFSNFGDRAKRQFGPDFPGHTVLEGTMLLQRLATTIYAINPLVELDAAQRLGPAGKSFVEPTRAGMEAFARLALIPGTDRLRPMLTDGTDLSGFVARRDGYYMRKGTPIEPYRAGTEFLLSYTRAALATGDARLWAMARVIGRHTGLGDLGSAPGRDTACAMTTRCADPRALFALVDLYNATRQLGYLALARRVGNNVVADHYRRGFFVERDDQRYANIDAIEPLALLSLEAAIRGEPALVPTYLGGSGFFSGDYLFPDGSYRQTNYDFLFKERIPAPTRG
ncbi:pectate disaccharide-lyase [mine drainage metagenome]|uniref:Pectate disaccharide-lyase n=1 Tax=mine drainage metagenome TaxID=410659 RepID=A0A1J5SQN3_9ZZZZ